MKVKIYSRTNRLAKVMYSTWDCWIAELQSEKGKGISPNFAFW